VQAVVLPGDGRVVVSEVSDPVLGPGEALLDVRLGGICGTDLQLARGYMGFRGVPGHEFVGTVRSVSSPADRVLVGARVVGEINLGCQDCGWCAKGLSRHCPRRRVLGILERQGAFARRLALPVSALHVVPGTLADEDAVFAEPLAAALEILDQVPVEPSASVLVMGDGRLGLLIAQVISSRGARVMVSGRHDSCLEIASRLGLAIQPAPRPPEPVHDLVVEATGSASGLDEAQRWCRPRGTVVMKSTCAGPTSFDASHAVVQELTLVGSRCGRMEPALEWLAAGRVQVAPLRTAEYPLEEAPDAFAHAARPGALKVLLRMAP
jgi:threonine dehydrogenase-like Zn-dependent dehydrogenase